MRRIVLLLACVAALASAQDRGMEVFAPFVSRLKAQAGETTVVLTWRNPADVAGAKLVYRSSEEIRADTLPAAAMVARLETQADSFEDKPPDGSSYYYAVLLESPDGRLFDLLIPFRNMTSQGVQISGPPPEEDLATLVTELRAEVVEDSVRVTFHSSRPQRELLLFRGTAPMTSEEHLLAADSPVALDGAGRDGAGRDGAGRDGAGRDAGVLDGAGLEYRDYPIPGVDTYYAVIDAGLFKVGQTLIVAGDNATRVPVQVPLSVARVALPPASPSRPLPLPYLRIPAATAERSTSSADLLVLAQARPLQPATLQTLARVLPATPSRQPAPRAVQILSEDRADAANGESRSLREILLQQLQTGRYSQAETALRGLLSIRRSQQTEARIRFYLGQSLYLQELYQEAAFEFLLARDQIYAYVQPWLEDSFRLMPPR